MTLKTGDTIGIFAPSSRTDKERINQGKKILESNGFKVFIHPQCKLEKHQSAGSAEEKAAAFHDLLNDPSINCIMAACGGNRALHSLPFIDWGNENIKSKKIIGFSDFTAILNAGHHKGGTQGYFGPDISWLPRMSDKEIELFINSITSGDLIIKSKKTKALNEGECTAPIFGGTLALLQSMIGTDHLPDASGHILFLEDEYEENSRIDRMLWQLKNALPFSKLKGLIFGSFTNCQDNGRLPFGFSLEDIIKEHTADLDIPIVMDMPFGHQSNFRAMPVGSNEVTLKVTKSATELSFYHPDKTS